MLDISQIENLSNVRMHDGHQGGRQHTDSLGQEDFLRLMIAQLQNQDPFDPMENGDFLGQMAQFSTVSGIGDLTERVEENSEILLGNQTLQAATLVGRSALVEADVIEHDGLSPVAGAVRLPDGVNQGTVRIRDATGEVVREIAVGRDDGGRARFEWDGLDDDGNPMAPGQYSIDARFNSGNQSEPAGTLLWGQIQSITFADEGEITMQLRGLGSALLNQAKEIS
ncbi:flagellar hook assembly protein FlgD [Wenzhouxiangella sp. AB-CW3]|uniref:flagellar hook assembly protein FlgD n=1 Tax=Wenzhouxiangella sp. AB-CW3 TaxID=2771012 RepID=UPI00168BF057|nr:flagellar hook assembly protein FlgD [Wenzhouxiangella sp. AB-CW3]QOC21227.1 flagellar hook assembly protein FlgD [Wenzhouxiangella sp. AB-CW3]